MCVCVYYYTLVFFVFFLLKAEKNLSAEPGCKLECHLCLCVVDILIYSSGRERSVDVSEEAWGSVCVCVWGVLKRIG